MRWIFYGIRALLGFPPKPRMYAVFYLFDGGMGVISPLELNVYGRTQRQLFDAIVSYIQAKNPDIRNVSIASIAEVPGK